MGWNAPPPKPTLAAVASKPAKTQPEPGRPAAHSYNPGGFEWNLEKGRVFVIKSYSEDDIHRSIKYSVWCSTAHGNKRLDGAFRATSAEGPVYLLYSVNGSGHFCGVAETRSPVVHGAGVWARDRWTTPPPPPPDS